jgi:hypothetical protein
MMQKKVPQILGLSAALAALSGAAAIAPTPTAANVPTADQTSTTQKAQAPTGEPNVLFSAGTDMLGLIVSTSANGTIVAQHYSHSSHASHSSHSSHYSSR